ncbi:MAG: CvpA family protein [Planctomycetaceae bacterium]|nr:CvpA family protein [Planctomycetaceae bacterium]
MQPYDIFMILILVGMTVYGLRKGMVWQVAAIASLVVSYFAALKFADTIIPFLNFQPPHLNRFVAMLIVYLAASALIWIMSRGVRNALERVQLKEFDHQVGMLFGAAKGVLYCIVITFFVVTLSASGRDAVLKSRSGDYIARFLHAATPVMPPEMREVLGPHIDRLEHQLDPNQPQLPTTAANNWRMPTQEQLQQDLQNGLQRTAEDAVRRAAEPYLNPNANPFNGPSPYAVPGNIPPTAQQPQPGTRPF